MDLPLMLDWKALKKLGHPYCRQQTYRLASRGFPKPIKLGPHRGSRAVWPTALVLKWYAEHGLTLAP